MTSLARVVVLAAVCTVHLTAAATLSLFGFAKAQYMGGPAGCVAPPQVTSFLTTDLDIVAFARFESPAAGDKIEGIWLDPWGEVVNPYGHGPFTFSNATGYACSNWVLTYSTGVRYTPAPGIWTFRLLLNDELIVSRQIEIIQSCDYKLSSATSSFITEASTGRVDVAAPAGCKWTAKSDADWVNVSSGQTGSGNGSVTFSVAANLGMPRTTTLIIAGGTHVVTQFGTGTGCTYQFDSTGADVPRRGGKATLKVFATPLCEWVARSNAAWVKINAPRGVGDGVLEYEADPNPACDAGRSTTIEAGGKAYALTQPPGKGAITPEGVLSSGSYLAGPIAPGELITVFGDWNGPASPAVMQLSPDLKSVTDTLSGVRLLFDGLSAPLLYASAGQLNAVVPISAGAKSEVSLQVDQQGCRSNSVVLTMTESSPSAFTADGSGKGLLAAVNQDGNINGPDHPAERDSVVVFWATGAGLTTPASVDGEITVGALPRPLLPVTVWIMGREAEILYAGAAPHMVSGVMQINVRVPADAPAGNSVPVQIGVGSAYSQLGTFISIR
jgi:uncharacterized protein (TIGR03437 family)